MSRERIAIEVVRALGVMNRGIDAYANAIRNEETNRVIALLEHLEWSEGDQAILINGDIAKPNDIIALIKGEQK